MIFYYIRLLFSWSKMLVSLFWGKHWCSWSLQFSHVLQGAPWIPLMCLSPRSVLGDREWWAGTTFICLHRDLFKRLIKSSYFILHSNYTVMMMKRFKMTGLSVLGRNCTVVPISHREAPACYFLGIKLVRTPTQFYHLAFVSFSLQYPTAFKYSICLVKFNRGRRSFPG